MRLKRLSGWISQIDIQKAKEKALEIISKISGYPVVWTQKAKKIIHWIRFMPKAEWEKLQKIAITMIVLLIAFIPATGRIMYSMVNQPEPEPQESMVDIMEDVFMQAVDGTIRNAEATIASRPVAIAPNVRGMKEEAAKEKLKDADFEDVRVKRKKMKFEKLVAASNELFFGEVKNQNQEKERVTLIVVEPDMTDELTANMVALGSRLAWPLPGYTGISSHFGARNSPGGIGSTNHKGIDIPAGTGKPIIAALKGKVVRASYYGGYGKCVILEHGNGFETLYGHMSMITCNVGDEVEPGDIIGRVGSTGASTGPHLHFSILKDGTYLDPEPFFTGKQNVEAGEEVSENEEEVTPDNEQKDTRTTTTKEPTQKETKPTKKPTKPSKQEETKAEETQTQAPIQPNTEETQPAKEDEQKEEKPEEDITEPSQQ